MLSRGVPLSRPQRAPWLAGWLAHMQAPVTVPGPKEPCAPGEDQEAKEAEGRCWSRVTPLSPPHAANLDTNTPVYDTTPAPLPPFLNLLSASPHSNTASLALFLPHTALLFLPPGQQLPNVSLSTGLSAHPMPWALWHRWTPLPHRRSSGSTSPRCALSGPSANPHHHQPSQTGAGSTPVVWQKIGWSFWREAAPHTRRTHTAPSLHYHRCCCWSHGVHVAPPRCHSVAGTGRESQSE